MIYSHSAAWFQIKFIVSLRRGSTAANARCVAGVRFECCHDGFFAAETAIGHFFEGLQNAFVILGHHLHELRDGSIPVLEQGGGFFAASAFLMLLDQRL